MKWGYFEILILDGIKKIFINSSLAKFKNFMLLNYLLKTNIYDYNSKIELINNSLLEIQLKLF